MGLLVFIQLTPVLYLYYVVRRRVESTHAPREIVRQLPLQRLHGITLTLLHRE